MFILEAVFYFFVWTLIIYWIHRLCHNVPALSYFHKEHHKYVTKNPNINWHWSNVFLFNDNWPSTIDYWLTEVIPTLIFSMITGQWWIAVLFYLYAATIQERVEHSRYFNAYPFYTSGQWHLLHHTSRPCNYGIITPFWDWVFGSNRKLDH